VHAHSKTRNSQKSKPEHFRVRCVLAKGKSGGEKAKNLHDFF
jgi:hypothetical protein